MKKLLCKLRIHKWMFIGTVRVPTVIKGEIVSCFKNKYICEHCGEERIKS